MKILQLEGEGKKESIEIARTTNQVSPTSKHC